MHNIRCGSATDESGQDGMAHRDLLNQQKMWCWLHTKINKHTHAFVCILSIYSINKYFYLFIFGPPSNGEQVLTKGWFMGQCTLESLVLPTNNTGVLGRTGPQWCHQNASLFPTYDSMGKQNHRNLGVPRPQTQECGMREFESLQYDESGMGDGFAGPFVDHVARSLIWLLLCPQLVVLMQSHTAETGSPKDPNLQPQRTIVEGSRTPVRNGLISSTYTLPKVPGEDFAHQQRHSRYFFTIA